MVMIQVTVFRTLEEGINNEGFPQKKYCRGTQNDKHRAPHLVQKKPKHLNSTIRDYMGCFPQSFERDCVFSPQQFRSLSFPFGDVPTHNLTKPQTMSELKTVVLTIASLNKPPGGCFAKFDKHARNE